MTTDDHPQCPFCTEEEAIIRNELGYVRYHGTPSVTGHLLILPKRHVADFFNIIWEEKFALVNLLAEARRYLADKYSPDGYKVEISVGEAAGQTVTHTHIHLIPFFKGGDAPRLLGSLGMDIHDPSPDRVGSKGKPDEQYLSQILRP